MKGIMMAINCCVQDVDDHTSPCPIFLGLQLGMAQLVGPQMDETSTNPTILLSIYLSIYLSIFLAVYLPTYLCTYLSIYVSTYLPICLSAYMY